MGKDQVKNLQNEVEGVKNIMTQNVERILARGENLDHLRNKTEDLEATVSPDRGLGGKHRGCGGCPSGSGTVWLLRGGQTLLSKEIRFRCPNSWWKKEREAADTDSTRTWQYLSIPTLYQEYELEEKKFCLLRDL